MPAGAALRVLLVDPSARMRRMLRVNLEGAGCAVTETDGTDLPARAAGVFDAVVVNLDARSPDVRDAVCTLRRRAPGLLVAGYSILPLDDHVRHMCIDIYVETPFDVARFVTQLRRAYDRSAAIAVAGAGDWGT